MNTPDQPIRVVVELLSGADVKRLEERDDDTQKEIAQLRREMEALRRSFYELLERYGSSNKK